MPCMYKIYSYDTIDGTINYSGNKMQTRNWPHYLIPDSMVACIWGTPPVASGVAACLHV